MGCISLSFDATIQASLGASKLAQGIISRDGEYIAEGQWFAEVHDGKQAISIKVREILHHAKSKFQDILIFDSYNYGRVLVLDGALMLSDIDEHMYHKALTRYGMQNAIYFVPEIEAMKILVIGAGDGGVVRDLIRNYDDHIGKITMVEIDEEVIDLSKKYFPDIACELNNSKVEIVCEDAIAYIDNLESAQFDLVLCDSTDPEGFAAGLIEVDFYKKIQRVLKEHGVFCAQTGSPFFQKDEYEKTFRNLRRVFDDVYTYYAPMLVYPGSFWSFTAAGKQICDKRNIDLEEFVPGSAKFIQV